MLSRELLRIVPQSIRVIRRLSTAQLDGATTIHHLRVMVLISEGHNQSQIADVLQISLPAVSKMLSGLEQRGLVKRTTGDDRRSRSLKLTAKGKKNLSTVFSGVENELNDVLIRLTAAEREDLARGLKALDKMVTFLKED